MLTSYRCWEEIKKRRKGTVSKNNEFKWTYGFVVLWQNLLFFWLPSHLCSIKMPTQNKLELTKHCEALPWQTAGGVEFSAFCLFWVYGYFQRSSISAEDNVRKASGLVWALMRVCFQWNSFIFFLTLLNYFVGNTFKASLLFKYLFAPYVVFPALTLLGIYLKTIIPQIFNLGREQWRMRGELSYPQNYRGQRAVIYPAWHIFFSDFSFDFIF